MYRIFQGERPAGEKQRQQHHLLLQGIFLSSNTQIGILRLLAQSNQSKLKRYDFYYKH